MPANKSRAALKTALLAPGGTLIAWGVQTAATDAVATGGVGVFVGFVLVGAFVLLEEYDIPYESEIRETASGVDQETVGNVGRDVAESVGDEIKDGD